jgi:anti-anti-sigma regulatory factor
MGLLNNLQRGLRAHGGVAKIVGAQANVEQSLRLCHFEKMFEFHDTIESALPATSSPA